MAIEATSEVNHEFVDGEMFALAGGTRGHAGVQTAVVGMLFVHLQGKTCRPVGSEARVYFPDYGDAAYPDAHVICGRTIRAEVDPEAAVNPTLAVEVLSPSTERWDRGGKFERYESLPSLLECILVTVDRRRVEVFRREPGEPFTRYVFSDGDQVEFRSIDFRFDIAELYAIADSEAIANAEAESPDSQSAD